MINLKGYLQQMKQAGVDIKETGDIVGFPTIQCDNKSIIIHDEEIEVYGFKNAEDETILTKQNGRLKFTNLDGVQKVNQVNPDTNNNISISKRFNTSVLVNDTSVTLNKMNTEDGTHNIIDWVVRTGEQAVVLLFSNTILYEYQDDNVIPPNCVFHYIFETFDGVTWLERVHKYNTVQTNNRIDSSFLLDNYYTKQEVNNLIHWKNQHQENIED